MLVSPVPNAPAPLVATATMRNVLSESLSGTSTVARPAASRRTRPFHSNRVSNSSRAVWRPPPPPCGNAFLP